MQTPLPCPGVLCWGSWRRVKTPYLSVGILQLRYPSSYCRGQPSLCLCPSYQPLCCFFYKAFNIILLFSCNSAGHSAWLNLVWHREEVSVAYTYSTAILKNKKENTPLYIHSIPIQAEPTLDSTTFICAFCFVLVKAQLKCYFLNKSFLSTISLYLHSKTIQKFSPFSELPQH